MKSYTGGTKSLDQEQIMQIHEKTSLNPWLASQELLKWVLHQGTP
jgi:hypothetical protein